MQEIIVSGVVTMKGKLGYCVRELDVTGLEITSARQEGAHTVLEVTGDHPAIRFLSHLQCDRRLVFNMYPGGRKPDAPAEQEALNRRTTVPKRKRSASAPA